MSKPFGGVPSGIKELEPVEGWPFTEGSLVFADRIADRTSVHAERHLASLIRYRDPSADSQERRHFGGRGLTWPSSEQAGSLE